jgi:ATP-binding protein involved in chromosome partitioning
MAWFTPKELPENKYYLFGKDGCKLLAAKLGIELLGQIPIVQGICESGDQGVPVALQKDSAIARHFVDLASEVVKVTGRRNKEMEPTKKVEITRTK